MLFCSIAMSSASVSGPHRKLIHWHPVTSAPENPVCRWNDSLHHTIAPAASHRHSPDCSCPLASTRSSNAAITAGVHADACSSPSCSCRKRCAASICRRYCRCASTESPPNSSTNRKASSPPPAASFVFAGALAAGVSTALVLLPATGADAGVLARGGRAEALDDEEGVGAVRGAAATGGGANGSRLALGRQCWRAETAAAVTVRSTSTSRFNASCSSLFLASAARNSAISASLASITAFTLSCSAVFCCAVTGARGASVASGNRRRDGSCAVLSVR
mmetsp:Transcript_49273/g.100617  ORF Transcript_49273/g.100617 Transcript_49273/m.100617 type:complete len:277 (+) Transcript_49273:1074-1904(+)